MLGYLRARPNNYRKHEATMLIKIQEADRVVYPNNPLAEVVCQARFVRMPELASPSAAMAAFAAIGFTKPFEPPRVNINVVAAGFPVPLQPSIAAYGATTEDGVWQVSFSADAVSLVCNKYLTWDDFLPRFGSVFDAYSSVFEAPQLSRIGLRYKDVINRETLGLSGAPWHQLIHPFLLGPLAAGVFADEKAIPEDQVRGALTHGVIDFGDCSLALQSMLLRSVEDARQTVFLIDADFFREFPEGSRDYKTSHDLHAVLDALHANAGAMFRRGIKEELHDALISSK